MARPAVQLGSGDMAQVTVRRAPGVPSLLEHTVTGSVVAPHSGLNPNMPGVSAGLLGAEGAVQGGEAGSGLTWPTDQAGQEGQTLHTRVSLLPEF